jgi:hypothetical protein
MSLARHDGLREPLECDCERKGSLARHSLGTPRVNAANRVINRCRITNAGFRSSSRSGSSGRNGRRMVRRVRRVCAWWVIQRHLCLRTGLGNGYAI